MPHKYAMRQGVRGRFDDDTEGVPELRREEVPYIREAERHDDVLEEKSIEEIALETGEDVLEVRDERKRGDRSFERIGVSASLLPVHMN